MRAIGFSPLLQTTIWNIVAAVLHLGNLEFEKKGDTCAVGPVTRMHACVSKLGWCRWQATRTHHT
jgi:myosin heavy subunit